MALFCGNNNSKFPTCIRISRDFNFKGGFLELLAHYMFTYLTMNLYSGGNYSKINPYLQKKKTQYGKKYKLIKFTFVLVWTFTLKIQYFKHKGVFCHLCPTCA